MLGEQLREGKNNLQAVGLLKSNNLVRETDKQGRELIKGDIVLECRHGENEIDEIRFYVYAFKGSKPYKNLEQALELTDKTNALDETMVAKVRVIGAVELNEYVSTKSNTFNSYNRNKAVYIHQTDRSTADMAKVELGCIINNIEEEDDTLYLDLLNVGYRNNILEIKDKVRVPDTFKEQVSQLYSPGDTAVVTIDVRNTAVVKEEEQTVAFGQVLEDKEIISEYVLSGGYPPLGDDNRYSDEEVERIRELRKQQRESIEAKLLPESSGGLGFDGFTPSDSSNPFA